MKNNLLAVVCLVVALSSMSASATTSPLQAFAGCNTWISINGSSYDTTMSHWSCVADGANSRYRATDTPPGTVYYNSTWDTSSSTACLAAMQSTVVVSHYLGVLSAPGTGTVASPSVPPSSVTSGGCGQVLYNGVCDVMSYTYKSNASQAYCDTTYQGDGSSSGAAAPTVGGPTGGACPSGQALGSVNGVSGCYPTGSGALPANSVAGFAPSSTSAASPATAANTPASAVSEATTAVNSGTQNGLITSTNAKLDTLIAAAPAPLDISGLNKESSQLGIKAAVQALAAAQCGGSGQPKCASAIDETGVSDSSSAVAKGAALVASYGTLTTAATGAASSGDASSLGLPLYVAPSSDSSAFVSPVFGSDTCTDTTATYRGVSFSMPICQITNPVKVIFGWFLSVFTAFYAWARFSGRIGKGA